MKVKDPLSNLDMMVVVASLYILQSCLQEDVNGVMTSIFIQRLKFNSVTISLRRRFRTGGIDQERIIFSGS